MTVGARTREVSAAGVTVRLEEWGKGPTVICLHGLGTGASVFSALGQLLANDHHIVALDLPGSGLSRLPPAFSFDLLAEVVVSVARALEIPRVGLIGHSMGTIIALEAIRRAPGLVAGFLAVGGLPEALPDARARIASRVEAIRREGMIGLGAGVAAANVSARTARERPDAAGLIARLFEMQPIDGYLATADALTTWTRRPLPPLDGVWCGAVTGEEDRYAPPHAVREFARTLPSDFVEVIDGCGHLPFLEDPAGFAAIVRAFFGHATPP